MTSVSWRAVHRADHLAAMRRDADRMASSAQGHLDSAVPSCPGWQLADLVWHVGIVQMFWRMVASGALSGPEAWAEPDRPDSDELLSWFRDGVELTGTVLASLAPDAPAWTWGRRKNVGFIQRRVAQETAVHCWDARTAIGCNEPIDQASAADGVDEFLDEVLAGLSHDLGGPAHTICLRACDSGQDWTVRAGQGSAHLIHGVGQAGATVTASASDLLLLLWGRCSLEQLHVDGQLAALQRFLARTRF